MTGDEGLYVPGRTIEPTPPEPEPKRDPGKPPWRLLAVAGLALLVSVGYALAGRDGAAEGAPPVAPTVSSPAVVEAHVTTVPRMPTVQPVTTVTARVTVTRLSVSTVTRTRAIVRFVPVHVTVRAKAVAPVCVKVQPVSSSRVAGELITAYGFGELCHGWVTLDTIAVSTPGPSPFTVTGVLYRQAGKRLVPSAVIPGDGVASTGHVVWVRRRIESVRGVDGAATLTVKVGTRTGILRLVL